MGAQGRSGLFQEHKLSLENQSKQTRKYKGRGKVGNPRVFLPLHFMCVDYSASKTLHSNISPCVSTVTINLQTSNFAFRFLRQGHILQ